MEKGCFKSRDKTERVVKLCYPVLACKGCSGYCALHRSFEAFFCSVAWSSSWEEPSRGTRLADCRCQAGKHAFGRVLRKVRSVLPIVIIFSSQVAHCYCRVFSQAVSGGVFPNWNALVEGIWDYCDTAVKVCLQNQIAPLNITIISGLIIY